MYAELHQSLSRYNLKKKIAKSIKKIGQEGIGPVYKATIISLLLYALGYLLTDGQLVIGFSFTGKLDFTYITRRQFYCKNKVRCYSDKRVTIILCRNARTVKLSFKVKSNSKPGVRSNL